MPLWKRLSIILGGVLLVVAVAIARVEYLSNFSPEQPAQGNYAAEIYQRYLESLQASLLILCKGIGRYFGGFVSFVDSHDKVIVALSTIFIAIFTIVLGFATMGLRRSTTKLWDVTRDGLKLARDEFNATHRPRVAVRRVWAQLVTKKEINVEFTIVNTGDGPIVSWIWNAQILLLDQIGEVHNILTYDSGTQKFQVGPLEVGEGTITNFASPTPLDPIDFLDISRKAKFLHIVGFVAYLDKVGVTRRTGFFRFYDPDFHRFSLVYDREYELEYQD